MESYIRTHNLPTPLIEGLFMKAYDVQSASEGTFYWLYENEADAERDFMEVFGELSKHVTLIDSFSIKDRAIKWGGTTIDLNYEPFIN